VCVEVSSFDEETGNWQSAIVRGTARLVDSDEVRQTLIARLFTKYEKVMGSPLSAGGGLMPLGGNPYVIEVKVEEVTGMTSDGGFRIRTKPGRL
jgi:nitroimidazol reductase NimA-like FMN-containing flavoprotein (pyridoxamine 5'-phosphate oxidase superfamily)